MILFRKIPTALEQFKVYLAIKLFWSNPKKKAQVLATFHSTEADSAWQLLHILPKLNDPKARYEVFQHILEEMVHSELFRKEATVYAKSQIITPSEERQAIYSDDAPIWKFFAYCIIGEKAALDRFSHVAKSLPDSTLRETFKKVLRDEAGHVHNAKMLAAEFAVNAKDIEQEVSAARRRRFKEAWMRQGTKITDIFANLFLSILYFLVAPLGYFAARQKIAGTVAVRTTENSIEQKRFLEVQSV